MNARITLTALIFVGVSSLNSLAYAVGGDSAGGGNLSKAQPIPALYLEQVIQSSRLSAALTLKAIEYNETWRAEARKNEMNDQQEMESHKALVRLLFAGSPSVYDVLKIAKLNVLKQGPCRDAAGEERDASALDGELCFSLERMSPKLNMLTVEREVVALMVHEASHLVGANEQTAVDLQHDAMAFSGVGLSLGNNRQIAELFNRQLDWFSSTIDQLIKTADSTERYRDANLCGTMSALNSGDPLGNVIEQLNAPQRLVLLSRTAMERLVVASMKLSTAAESYCAKDKPLSARKLDAVIRSRVGASEYQMLETEQELQIHYGREAKLTLKEYSEEVGHPMSVAMFAFPDDVLRFVAKGDIASLRLELRDAAAALKLVRAAAPRF